MDLNIVTFAYLFLRLAPFILVCFFSLASIFNQDIKGLVYLVGLLITVTLITLTGKLLSSYPLTLQLLTLPVEAPGICNMITIGQSGMLSALPLGQAVLSFTFFYLLSTIINQNIIYQNIATIVFFTVLIVSDLIWNISYGCNTIFALSTSIFIGFVSGIIWSMIISSMNRPSLLYFTGIGQKESCSRPSRSTFKCNVYKNGKLISKNIG